MSQQFEINISFQSSLEVLVTEEDGRDNTVEISVIRKQGFFGRVTVKWSATGDQNGLSDLTPLEGTVSSVLFPFFGRIIVKWSATGNQNDLYLKEQ